MWDGKQLKDDVVGSKECQEELAVALSLFGATSPFNHVTVIAAYQRALEILSGLLTKPVLVILTALQTSHDNAPSES
jgi:mannose/fructose-specific phosphotransferase system component IIA